MALILLVEDEKLLRWALEQQLRRAGHEVHAAPDLTTAGEHLSHAYFKQYGLPTDGSADSLDTDGDGNANLQHLTKAGRGRMALTSANTYTGTTTVQEGTLLANNTTGSATGTVVDTWSLNHSPAKAYRPSSLSSAIRQPASSVTVTPVVSRCCGRGSRRSARASAASSG